MKYLRCRWIHSHPNEPVLLYSELDDRRMEVRTIEIWRDGRKGFASAIEFTPETGLGLVPVPELAEIAADPEFEPSEISEAEFEEVWVRRKEPEPPSTPS